MHMYIYPLSLSLSLCPSLYVNSSTTARNIRSQLSRGVVGLAIKYKTLPIGRAWTPYFRNFKTTSLAILEAYPVGPPSGTFNSIAKTHPMEMILSTESKELRRFKVVSSQNSFNFRIGFVVVVVVIVVDDDDENEDEDDGKFGFIVSSVYTFKACAATAHPIGYAVYEWPCKSACGFPGP